MNTQQRADHLYYHAQAFDFAEPTHPSIAMINASNDPHTPDAYTSHWFDTALALIAGGIFFLIATGVVQL